MSTTGQALARADNTPATRQDVVPDLVAMGLDRREAASMWSVCQVLSRTTLVAKPLQGNPEACMGVALYLHGFGIPISLVTINKVHVWEDDIREKRGDKWVTVGTKICMQEHYQVLLGLLHRAGHDAWMMELDDDQCTFGFRHRDHPERAQAFTYTMAMATKAGLADKKNWRTNPHFMLPAAAVRMVARLGAPEVLLGLDIADEAGKVVQPIRPPLEITQAAPNVEAGNDSVPTEPSPEAFAAGERTVDQGGGKPLVSAVGAPTPTRPNPHAKAVHIAASEAGVSAEKLDDIIQYVTGDPSANGVTRENKDQVLALIQDAAEQAEMEG